MRVVLLIGASAAGKTTLVKNLAAHVTPLQRVSFGEILYEMKKALHPGLSYAQMRAAASSMITVEDLEAADQEVITRVGRMRVETNVIIESHPVVATAFGFRMTPFERQRLRELNPTGVVLLWCPAEVLLARMKAERGGQTLLSPAEIEHHHRLQEAVAVSYSTAVGCPLFVARSDAEPMELAQQIGSALNSLDVH